MANFEQNAGRLAQLIRQGSGLVERVKPHIAEGVEKGTARPAMTVIEAVATHQTLCREAHPSLREMVQEYDRLKEERDLPILPTIEPATLPTLPAVKPINAPRTTPTPSATPRQPGKAKKVLTAIGKGIVAVIAASAVGGGIGVAAPYAVEAYSKPAPYVLIRPKGELFYIESKVNGEWKAAKDVKETDFVAESSIAIPVGLNKYTVFPVERSAERTLATYIRKAQEDARKKGTLASQGVYFTSEEIEQLIYEKILKTKPGQAGTITFAQCQMALDELAKQD